MINGVASFIVFFVLLIGAEIVF
jgi:cytochrome b involved in lipid metabolism